MATGSRYETLALALPDLLAYYPLDDTGSTALDLGPGSHHGTVGPATLVDQPEIIPAEVPLGGRCMEFVHSLSSGVTLPTSLQLPIGSQFTVFGWVQVNRDATYETAGLTVNRPVFNIGDLDNPNRCVAHIPNMAGNAAGRNTFDFGTWQDDRLLAPGFDQLGLWDRPVFIAYRAAAATRAQFINGRLQGGDTDAGAPAVVLSGGGIGRWNGGRPIERFVGRISGIGFVRRALSSVEIRQLYCAGWPGACGGWAVGRVGR